MTEFGIGILPLLHSRLSLPTQAETAILLDTIPILRCNTILGSPS